MSKNKSGSSEQNSGRANRRKRRKRNQAIAISVVIVLLLGIGVGGFFGISKLSEVVGEQMQAEAEPETESVMTETATEELLPEIEEPTTVVEEYTDEDLLNDVVQSCIDEMSLEDKVAGLFIVTPEGLTGVDKVVKAGDGTKEAIEKYPVGGIIYFAQNIQSEDQITEMLANTVSYSKYPLFLAVDEEGGEVARLQSSLKLDKTPTAAELGEGGDATAVNDAYKTIATRLTTYGFNLDMAPVADVLLNEDNKAIGDRSFGNDANLVADMIAASVPALQDNGVTACLKHFPGQGAVDADTHEGMATTDRSVDDIKSTELVPFVKGIESGAQMIMVGHFIAPALTGDSTTPCSLSKEVMTDLLRGEYGYEGVIITDAMNMASISEYYGADEAAIKALKAGADMVLMPEDFETAYNGVLEAVKDGTISEQRINDSLARVYRIKYASTIE